MYRVAVAVCVAGGQYGTTITGVLVAVAVALGASVGVCGVFVGKSSRVAVNVAEGGTGVGVRVVVAVAVPVGRKVGVTGRVAVGGCGVGVGGGGSESRHMTNRITASATMSSRIIHLKYLMVHF